MESTGREIMRKKKSFTLVELLVVIIVVAVSVEMLLAARSTVRARAQEVECTANLKTLIDATKVYMNDYQNSIGLTYTGGEWLGGEWRRFGDLLYKRPGSTRKPVYVTDPGVMICPLAAPEKYDKNDDTASLFTYGVILRDKAYDDGVYKEESIGNGKAISLNFANLKFAAKQMIYFDSIDSSIKKQVSAVNSTYVSGNTGIHLRHTAAANTAMADGHVETLTMSALGELNDIPESGRYLISNAYGQNLEVVNP